MDLVDPVDLVDWVDKEVRIVVQASSLLRKCAGKMPAPQHPTKGPVELNLVLFTIYFTGASGGNRPCA